MDSDVPDVTRLVEDVRRGRDGAVDALLPLVYGELRALAAVQLKHERPGHTLQPTALVHEAYMRLVDQTQVTWRSRAHFLAAAANTIRRILVDSARRKGAAKRGAGWQRVELDAVAADGAAPGAAAVDLLSLDEALKELARMDPRAARVVELRYFGGMGMKQAAEVLGVSIPTVERDWASARAWLLGRLDDTDRSDDPDGQAP